MFWLALGCVPPFDRCQPCGRQYRLLGNPGLQRAIFRERMRAQRGRVKPVSPCKRRRKGRRNRERRASA